VAPHNLTLPHGFGPAPGIDGLWSDWNPRYALGGDSQGYATPPPRFESYIVRELLPYVGGNFPAGSGREWRAIDGRSQGGVGAAKIGLQYPDAFASIGSISGGASPTTIGYTAASPAARRLLPTGIAAPVETTHAPLPGLLSALYPAEMPGGDNLITTAIRGILFAWGDPVADEAYHRAQNPKNIAMNARAWAGDVGSVPIRFIVNDVVPRRGTADANAQDLAFEAAALLGSVELSNSLGAEGVAHDFEIHPGTHAPVYHRPFYRQLLEAHWAHVCHRDREGSPPPAPDVFDHRSVYPEFEVWGWLFRVDREAVEFLNVYDASCDGLTLQGSGRVTVTVPESCGTGLDGETTFEVDLGPSFPADERGPAGEAGAYGNRARVELARCEPNGRCGEGREREAPPRQSCRLAGA
jgi:S-formylglutathione hydrolase FrmB